RKASSLSARRQHGLTCFVIAYARGKLERALLSWRSSGAARHRLCSSKRRATGSATPREGARTVRRLERLGDRRGLGARCRAETAGTIAWTRSHSSLPLGTSGT